jgi:hypothetical protein
MRISSVNLDEKVAKLIRTAWQDFADVAGEPFVVKPSIPILFFGNSVRYFSSPLRVVTLGLNPSAKEFPDDKPFLRFGKARRLNSPSQDHDFVNAYLDALNGYFASPPNHPYERWFNSFEPLLQGLRCSYYGGAANTALHTDICSPFATTPTWRKVSPDIQFRLMKSGTPLWHALIDWLSPDLIIASVARSHLDRISFVRETGWLTVYTIDRKNPYDVELTALRLPDGKTAGLVFGKAAQLPFGTLSNEDKRKIGEQLRAYLDRRG